MLTIKSYDQFVGEAYTPRGFEAISREMKWASWEYMVDEYEKAFARVAKQHRGFKFKPVDRRRQGNFSYRPRTWECSMNGVTFNLLVTDNGGQLYVDLPDAEKFGFRPEMPGYGKVGFKSAATLKSEADLSEFLGRLAAGA